MTEVTKKEIDKMDDEEFLQHLRIFSYPSQWLNKDAFKQAEMRLTYITGKHYQRTGNIKFFNMNYAR